MDLKWSILLFSAGGKASIGGSNGTIAIIFTCVVWCLWQPKCRCTEGMDFISGWKFLLVQLIIFKVITHIFSFTSEISVLQTVVFCLVDIYIVLGKAFLPYLGSLSSTQLRLVTIYANRISQVLRITFIWLLSFSFLANEYVCTCKQARSGGPLDAATLANH